MLFNLFGFTDTFMKKFLKFFVAYFSLLAFVALVNAEDNRPAVAIKSPEVGDSVEKWVAPLLDIGLLQAEMEASFTATRKFRVLSRNVSSLKAIRAEQKFSGSELASGDAAASGEISNANYLILPVVQDFKFYRQHKLMPNFDDKWFRVDSGLLQVSAQMIDTSSSQVVTTFAMKSKFASKRKVVNDKQGKPSSEEYTRMAKNIAAQLADLFVNQVFPMKVVARDRRGRITINRGVDGGLKLKDQLEVFYAGEELIDPDTGESLGVNEEYVGLVEVTRINPKITVTKIISEEDAVNAPITVGDILRRPQ
ncbi:MAG: hypothetical protein KUG79_09180 [Pseudomonadales bacterium]|nr:hypothetical protein [Pseudomonadales bacterium]